MKKAISLLIAAALLLSLAACGGGKPPTENDVREWFNENRADTFYVESFNSNNNSITLELSFVKDIFSDDSAASMRDSIETTVRTKFDYKKIDVVMVERTISMYEEHSLVPDFGRVVGVPLVSSDNTKIAHVRYVSYIYDGFYVQSSISGIAEYEELLQSLGFQHIKDNPNSHNTIMYGIIGDNVVSVEFPMIPRADGEYKVLLTMPAE